MHNKNILALIGIFALCLVNSGKCFEFISKSCNQKKYVRNHWKETTINCVVLNKILKKSVEFMKKYLNYTNTLRKKNLI